MENLQLNPKLVQNTVIVPVLRTLEPHVPFSVSAVELLLGTAATESHLGLWLRQLGGGPALGLYQIEPETEWDVWNNYLAFRPELRKAVQGWQSQSANDLEYNHAYATAIARLIYRRSPLNLPLAGNIEGQASMWKQVYNTPKGKGSVEKYLKDWRELVEGKV